MSRTTDRGTLRWMKENKQETKKTEDGEED
jgi:hypothetical protein